MNSALVERAGGGEAVLANASIVLDDQTLLGSLKIVDGKIAAIDEQQRPGAGNDLEGDYLIPGLIDLHTDNLERHYQPRSGVFWDPINAVIAHDTQIIGSGITTVFDSLAVGVNQGWDRRAEMIDVLCAALETAQTAGMVRADHRLHLRCEVTHPHIVSILEGYLAHPLLAFMSLMDHAPGDRQSPDIDSWRKFYLKFFDFDEKALDRYQDELLQNSKTLAPHHRRKLGEIALARRLPLASHDDATPAHIEEAADLAAVLTEFPTTVRAAEAARQHDLHVLMGSPNLMRGKSQSGNVAAGDLAASGQLDILSSDYIPGSLLPAAFKLTEAPVGMGLPEAMRTVTRAPAQAAGLDDRGEVAIGKRADLVRVRTIDKRPIIRAVWRAGERVA